MYEARSVNRFPVRLFYPVGLLDNVSGRATVFEVEHQHFAPLAQTSLLPAISSGL